MTNEGILMDGNEGEHPETVAANLTSSCIYSMLDQARKDEAVEFVLWVNKNAWLPAMKGIWYRKFGTPEYESHTTEELYQLFKQSTITNKTE